MEVKSKPQNFLILNNIRSCENVGSLFRICDSCNVNLIIQGYTPHPKIDQDDRLPYIIAKDTSKILKTATESLSNVSFLYFKTEEEVFLYLEDIGIPIYCLEIGHESSKNLFDFSKLNTPFALVVGNEKTGVSDTFLLKSTEILYIPMLGQNKSLNVAVSAAIALYKLILG